MTSLNNIVLENSYKKIAPEVLIELPSPKLINDNCTIIMNGHHNYGMSVDKDTDMEVPVLLNTPHGKTRSNNGTISSKNMIPMKDTFAQISSAEEDSEAELELESSTHLLQDKYQVNQSPKCTKNKQPKIVSFKSSPSKKQTSEDPHSHIQHRPLGLPQDTAPDHLFHIKRYWPFSSLVCMLFVAFSVLVVVACLAIGLYFAIGRNCEPTRQWWQSSAIYEIFPASFQDIDGDGFGDLKGLTQRLDYIKNLSISIIRLNSIFSALDYPLEYEHVIDFSNLDPHLGRLEDFHNFIKELHDRGMYVILDINPTVTSDQHTWAAHWLLHRPGPFHQFYINITDEEGDEPPLESNTNYEDKTWSPPHRTFGSHLYLNWSNALLQMEMQSVFEMWLSQGIDGFYIKHLDNLHVTEKNHLYAILHQWRQVLDRYSINSTRKVLMVSEDDMRHLQTVLSYADVPSLVDLVDAGMSTQANGTWVSEVCARIEEVQNFLAQFPYQPHVVWHVGGVETTRLASRVSEDFHMAAMFVLTALPGSMSVFYGDEIGMLDTFNPVTIEVYRGGQLAPMQWSSEYQAGFTKEGVNPWLPIHPSYMTKNIESNPIELRLFKKLLELKLQDIISETQESSLIHTLTESINNPFDSTDMDGDQWYYNRCGLSAFRFIASDLYLVANFGSHTVGLANDANCRGRMDEEDTNNAEVFFAYGNLKRQFRILLSTNDALYGEVNLKELLLESGVAVIGRFVT